MSSRSIITETAASSTGGSIREPVERRTLVERLRAALADTFDVSLPEGLARRPLYFTPPECPAPGRDLAFAPDPREDGLRTDPETSEFEWWFNEGEFDDGSSVVVAYFTKPFFTLRRGARPFVSIRILTPTGRCIERSLHVAPEQASFSSDRCELRIGSATHDGDLDTYRMRASGDDVEVDLTLRRTSAHWLPASGRIGFGSPRSYFAWYPPVCNGDLKGTLTYDGEVHRVRGSGYHDHNWGNTSIARHIERWWWTRAQVGNYTVLAINQQLKKSYGEDTWIPALCVIDAERPWLETSLSEVRVQHEELDRREHPDPRFPTAFPHLLTFRATRSNGDWAEIRHVLHTARASKDILELPEVKSAQALVARALGLRPWYSLFNARTTLSFDIDGVSFTGEGHGTVESMKLR